MKFKLTIDCLQKWSSMTGGDKIRHCGMCKKNIHNLEEFSEEEAQDIIVEGDNCVRMEVNQRGQIKTNSGFSKSLFLMGLAMGCVESSEKNTNPSNPDQSQIERIEIGEVAVEQDRPNQGTDSNTKGTETQEKDESRPHFVGKVKPKKEEKKEAPQKGDSALDKDTK